MNKYQEEGLIKSGYIFYKLIINWWSISFTKTMLDYEILADSQHYKIGWIISKLSRFEDIKCAFMGTTILSI